MPRCNPTMHPGANGCSTLAAALFAAGIPGAGNIDCMKNCASCRSEAAALRLRLVSPPAEAESSSPQPRR